VTEKLTRENDKAIFRNKGYVSDNLKKSAWAVGGLLGSASGIERHVI